MSFWREPVFKKAEIINLQSGNEWEGRDDDSYDSSDSGIGPKNLTVRPPARAQGAGLSRYRKFFNLSELNSCTLKKDTLKVICQEIGRETVIALPRKNLFYSSFFAS